jgi:peptidoglycan hydrolase CwlO-like protein
MTNDELNMLTTAISSLVLILTAWFLVVKFISPFFKRIASWVATWEGFMRDWSGEEARPGRSRVPGVMERLNSIDGELKNNGGSSVKDAVDRIENKISTIDNRVADGDKKFDDLYNEVKSIKKNFYN